MSDWDPLPLGRHSIESLMLMQRVWMMDSKGIITESRGDKLASHKQRVARTDDTPPIKDLLKAVQYVKPHTLIGLTGHGPAFTQVTGTISHRHKNMIVQSDFAFRFLKDVPSLTHVILAVWFF